MTTTEPPGARTAALPTERPPTYRDQQLHTLVKALRASVRSYPPSRIALERVEGRLRYVLRVIETWDASHAGRARELIRLGQLAAANGSVTMIFDSELRQSLYRQCFVGSDDSAGERMEEAALMGREIL